MSKQDKEYEQFMLDMLFVAVAAHDHEDAMGDILDILTDEDEDYDFNDILDAHQYASMYHEPTSLEEEALKDVRFTLAFRNLNG